jgi:hypothetical protein
MSWLFATTLLAPAMTTRITTVSRWRVVLLSSVLAISGCSQLNLPAVLQPAAIKDVDSASHADSGMPTDVAAHAGSKSTLWTGNFSSRDWRSRWSIRQQGDWGWQNTALVADPTFSKVLRVRYPAGSASPTVSRKTGAPLGGAQFYTSLPLAPRDSLRLSYYVRFTNEFDFVKGGKLPGLFGGSATSGGEKPDGTNGFSTRFMWRRDGQGEVYAYLPTSSKYGTSIGRGQWYFTPGTWHHLEQQVDLNQPEKSNGRVQVWLDGKKVLDQRNLRFRATQTLKIEGIFFSTFFGGNDPSWATPKDVAVDFANFSMEP